MCEVRCLSAGQGLVLSGAMDPVLLPAQDIRRMAADPAHVRAVVAGLTAAAVDLVEPLAIGDWYHA